ncbi:NUDIX domain-containing protein [Thermodesulfobacteriota bacterium]
MNRKLRVVLIILYDSENRLLLQHRTTDALTLPDYWAFFGGGIKKGETPMYAVHREALEELNCKIKKPILVFEQSFQIERIDGYMYVFIDEYYGNKSVLRLQEGQGWGWYKESEIDELKMIDHDREIVKKISKYLKNKIDNEDEA